MAITIFKSKSVADVLKVFTTAIADLQKIEETANANVKTKEAQISKLNDEAAAESVVANEAANVRAKLAELIGTPSAETPVEVAVATNLG